MAEVTIAPGSASAEGSVGWERVRAVAGIGLSIAALLGVVIFLLNAVRVGSAGHVVPTDIVHRWRRDFAVLAGIAVLLLAGGVPLSLPPAPRRPPAFRPLLVVVGILTLPPWFALLVLVGNVGLLA